MLKQFLEIGKIVGTHALKGELRVEPWCDSPQFLCSFKNLYLKNGEERLPIEKARPHKNIVIMKLTGIDTIEQADLMRGKILYMNRADANLGEDTYFMQDIIGLSAKNADTNKLYGKITDVFKTGANDVYQITDDNGKDYLIPVIPDVVIETNITEEYILIRPLKGIFEDED